MRAVLGIHIFLDRRQVPQDRPGLAGQVHVHKVGRQVGDRPSDIGRPQVQELARGGREALHLKFSIDEHRGNVRAHQQIGEIVIAGDDVLDLLL